MKAKQSNNTIHTQVQRQPSKQQLVPIKLQYSLNNQIR